MKCVRKHCLNTKYGTSATTAFSSPTSKATRSAKQTTRDEETANPEGEKKQNKEEKKNLKGKNKKKHLTVVYESFADPSQLSLQIHPLQLGPELRSFWQVFILCKHYKWIIYHCFTIHIRDCHPNLLRHKTLQNLKQDQNLKYFRLFLCPLVS